MAELVSDCPRCGASEITMDTHGIIYRKTEYNWQHWYEVFVVCRRCHKSSIMFAGLKKHNIKIAEDANYIDDIKGALNDVLRVSGPITLKDNHKIAEPDYLPEDVSAIFREAVSCLAIGCYNASATMFRLCLDMATRRLLPALADQEVPQPSSKHRRELGLRMEWLFEQNVLPCELQKLSDCVREDANDGAHRGSLGKEDAEDLLDFCTALLERIFTEPEKLRRASQRRQERRKGQALS